MKKITRTLCMLLIACMGTAVQAIAQVNYMEGWDAGGSTSESPYDAGWRTTDVNVTWNDCDPINPDYYQYRDNLSVGRVFIHPQNASIFSFPVNGLKAKTFYQFSCSSAKMSGNQTRPTTFAINTAKDGTGSVLGSDNHSALKWDKHTNHSFRFVSVNAGNYYMTWQTENSDGDRSLAWGFNVVELGEALTAIFNTDGGNPVNPQYLLSGANEMVTKPADPTREGYIFKGWYSDSYCTEEYDFASPVTVDVIIYAKWQDIKEELKALVVTANGLLTGGTEKGQTYLNGFITAAQTVIDKASATVDEVTLAFNNLTTAIAAYQDASLKDLSINGNIIAGFSANVYQYIYSLSPADTEIPVVTVAISAECADYVITPAVQLPGNTTIMVTAGNGTTQTYTINFAIDYMSGWDADGLDKSPADAGWYTTDETITWTTGDLNGMGYKYQYRDNLAKNGNTEKIGRVFIHPTNHAVFSYPLVGLKAGKAYTFTCTSATMNGDGRSTVFSVNTANDGNGVTLGQDSRIATKWENTTDYCFSFIVPVDGTYYLIWQTKNEGAGDRSFAYGFKVLETTISASNVSTFPDNALIAMSELKLEGDFTADNITALNAKLGANNVLTSVDLTKATVATDAVDVFAALNPNTLKYFVDGATVPAAWTNTVIGNTAVTITLTDGYNFNNVKAFTTSAIAYKRTFAKGWSTFGLPFAMTDISELGSVEKFSEVKDNTIIFDAATEIIACNPYLINAENEAEKIFSATNTEVPVTVAEAGIFNTTFNELTATEAEGKFILTDEGEVQKFSAATTETTIPAFRAYITIAESEPDAVYNVEHKSNDPNVINNTKADDRHLIVYSPVSGTIIIDAATDQEIMICSIDGRLVRKVIVAGGESKTINDLAKGIYLVNNQKVVIK